MSNDVRVKLEQAIREADERNMRRLRAAHDRVLAAEKDFEPVEQAAVELQGNLSSLNTIDITINPSDVWISLFDRELRFSFDTSSRAFVGEERLHSWYDGKHIHTVMSERRPRTVSMQ